jgi:hypothetical protein
MEKGRLSDGTLHYSARQESCVFRPPMFYVPGIHIISDKMHSCKLSIKGFIVYPQFIEGIIAGKEARTVLVDCGPPCHAAIKGPAFAKTGKLGVLATFFSSLCGSAGSGDETCMP